ncbi:hypothetical protein ABT294_35000 [Nonomuraea sp. NPDC000554]|uniref:hypothetical protein n=1 Tax=Nonomuraea sp. NPDC000554 TaxID=3154259 RepID=UPI0033263AB0
MQDRITRIEGQATALHESAGTGTVAGAQMDLFDRSLVIFRDELRARLRKARPAHSVPILAEASARLSTRS